MQIETMRDTQQKSTKFHEEREKALNHFPCTIYIKIYSFLFVEMESCDLCNECKTEFRFIQCIHFSQTQHFSLIYIFIKAQCLAYRLAIYGVYKTLCGTHMSFQREHLKYVQYHRNYARIRAVL